MDKQERYINFIVEDLVKNTEIDYDNERIVFPFSTIITSFPSYSSRTLTFTFSEYVKERYGVRDEEVEQLWEIYRGRIKSLIKK